MKRILFFLALSLLMAVPAFAAEIDGEVYIGEDGGTLNLREGPGMGYEVIGYVDHGDEVVILSYGPDWSFVRVSEEKTGYIASKYLDFSLDEFVPEFSLRAVDASYAMPADITEDGCYASDLDGDGYTETVTVYTLEDEYGGVVCLRIEGVDQAPQDVITSIHTRTRIQIADFDGEDGGFEILVSGDVMSDDYETWCIRYRAGDTAFVPFLSDGEEYSVMNGGASAVESGVVTIDRALHLFGTWWSYRDFELKDGSLVPASDSIWTTGEAEALFAFSALTTARDVPVRFGNGAEDVLPTGTRLVITGSNGVDEAYFETEDGKTGVIAYESDGGVCYVSSIPEDELFTGMLYAD